MAVRSLAVHIEGTAPLLLSNVASSDPLGEGAKQKAFFSGKKKKSDDDHRALRILDWIQSGYWVHTGDVMIDEAENQVGFDGFSTPYLPGSNFQRCIRNGATKWKLGKDTLRAVVVTNNAVIEYDGPKDAVEMFNSRTPKYQLASFTGRGVWVNRLCIPVWSCEFELTLDDEILSVDQLRRILNMSGKGEGLGTWRPRYGRFVVTAIDELAEE
jgi:hypothetical protein